MSKSIDNLRYFLKEMFQFNENDLDFGIYKIYNLKRNHIESFIDGDNPNDLAPTIEETLKEVNLANQKTDAIDLENFLKKLNQENLLNDPEANYKQLELFISTEQNQDKKTKLTETLNTLSKSEGITDELKDKIYNHILGFFQMYYSNGDFGYNDRSRDLYKVPYEADYNGSDTMFHWKHKGSLYIKTGTSFNAIKFDLNGKKIEYRLETNENSEEEGTSQNNNKDSQLKHYRFDRIEKVKDKATKETIYQVVFNLSDASTSKVEIFKAIYKEVFKETAIDKYLEYTKDDKTKQVFVDLTKDFDKVQNGAIKGLSALRQKKLKIEKEVKNNFDRGVRLYDEETKQFTDETLKSLYTLDQKLNSFYIGNDADYFIHENLNEFLTNEKNRYVKNYIFDDLESIYAGKLDNTTLLIAKAFDKVGTRIIEFLSTIEDFQKHLFTKKKKVVESEYCITADYIDENYYQEILENKTQLKEWQNLFSLEIKTIEDIKANPTLVLDTKCFKQIDGTNPFKDKIISEIDDLDDKTNGVLFKSENHQGLNFIETKFLSKIDCIYIDPPYNTGDDGFAYKDNFKHSSWITMMENRLFKAKKVLDKGGLIFINIGEQEYFRLKSLLEEVFGNNSISTLIWKKKKQPSFLSQVGTMTDYIFVYAKDKALIKKLSIDKASDGTRRVDNASNPISEMLILKGIESKGLKVGVIKKGIYQNKSMSTEYLEDVVIKDGIVQNDFKVKANFRNKQEAITLFSREKLIYITEKYSFRRYPTDEEMSRNKSISNLLTDWGDNQDSNKEKENLYNDLGEFPYPKPTKLIENIVKSIINPNAFVLDFFGGTGTTAHSVLNLNKNEGKRKYMLMEMGDYFDKVLTKRVVRRIFSENWQNCKPLDNNGSLKHIFKYQVLEQYEDVLDNLQVYKGALPENLPIKYLYKPEENSLDTTLNLFTPFSNTINYGQPTQKGFIDLTETYNYLQGYFIKSIKTYELNKKYYKVIETTNGVLVIWRDIAINEDDSTQIIEITSKHTNIHTIEVNAEFATLTLDKSNHLKVGDEDIELKIISKEIFNQ
ncbi:site-specific DNA-methyltransferase [Polaribacter sp. Q13]|uniref:site-specific DNA-methyltransferase n=1 Tax=Polaribacter sp. Q13 TaxID=2806551 RepID=UPI00193B44F9|nr:site-specific DNA-methyltransferase [Polaribacter sp. Q13]QVY67072.1 site-specific DNA-methyltransferase [Polaribacter sp. Q13]